MCKITGSTILETMVSLTILLSILTISFVQIDRINASINPQVLYKAHLITSRLLIADDLLIEMEQAVEIEGFIVKKFLEQIDQNLFVVELVVIDLSGRQLYTRKKIVDHGIDL